MIKTGSAADDVTRSELSLTDEVTPSVTQRDAFLREIGTLKTALRSSRRIGQAMGVIMALAKVTEDQAFDRLRHASQVTNRKLREVAEDVVATGVVPPEPPVTGV